MYLTFVYCFVLLGIYIPITIVITTAPIDDYNLPTFLKIQIIVLVTKVIRVWTSNYDNPKNKYPTIIEIFHLCYTTFTFFVCLLLYYLMPSRQLCSRILYINTWIYICVEENWAPWNKIKRKKSPNHKVLKKKNIMTSTRRSWLHKIKSQ